MNRYEVSVVASYRTDVDGPQAIERGLSALDTSAVDWEITTSVRIPPRRQTLTVSYKDVEGRDESKAKQFAMFKRESGGVALPEPGTFVANIN